MGEIKQHIDKHFESKNSNQVKMITTTLNNILDTYNAPTTIDYMSLDTDGSELEILKGLDMDQYKNNKSHLIPKKKSKEAEKTKTAEIINISTSKVILD